MDTGRALTLTAATGLLLAGVAKASDPRMSAGLWAAGFILLGAWLAVEIITRKDDRP